MKPRAKIIFLRHAFPLPRRRPLKRETGLLKRDIAAPLEMATNEARGTTRSPPRFTWVECDTQDCDT